MQSRHHPHPLPNSQHGAALITGLLIMIVMTFIGITAMQSSLTQGNLATNAQLGAMGFQATEAALTRAANTKSLLDTALGYGVGKRTDFREYNRYQAVLDIQMDGEGKESLATIPISTDIQVTPLGKKETCSKATELNGNQSTTKTTPSCVVFELIASTSIGTNASAVHTQRSDRFVPAQAGIPPYKP